MCVDQRLLLHNTRAKCPTAGACPLSPKQSCIAVKTKRGHEMSGGGYISLSLSRFYHGTSCRVLPSHPHKNFCTCSRRLTHHRHIQLSYVMPLLDRKQARSVEPNQQFQRHSHKSAGHLFHQQQQLVTARCVQSSAIGTNYLVWFSMRGTAERPEAYGERVKPILPVTRGACVTCQRGLWLLRYTHACFQQLLCICDS